MNRSDTITKLIPALLKAKAEFAPAIKGALNPAFKSKYVALDGVLDAVEPALLRHGIALAQPTHIADGVTILETLLIHESGEWMSAEYPVKPVQATPQGEGSALTYARRYSLMSLCGIAPEDDDGNAASRAPSNVTDQRQPLFTEIKTLGHRKGMSDREIADDFIGWSQGVAITEAPKFDLEKYRDQLKRGAAS